jgi:hypothetical protein
MQALLRVTDRHAEPCQQPFGGQAPDAVTKYPDDLRQPRGSACEARRNLG